MRSAFKMCRLHGDSAGKESARRGDCMRVCGRPRRLASPVLRSCSTATINSRRQRRVSTSPCSHTGSRGCDGEDGGVSIVGHGEKRAAGRLWGGVRAAAVGECARKEQLKDVRSLVAVEVAHSDSGAGARAEAKGRQSNESPARLCRFAPHPPVSLARPTPHAMSEFAPKSALPDNYAGAPSCRCRRRRRRSSDMLLTPRPRSQRSRRRARRRSGSLGSGSWRRVSCGKSSRSAGAPRA